MDLQPLGDRLIVEVLEEEETTTSGIVLPDTAKEKPQRGKILAVGPGSRNDSGELVPMDVAEGDEIIFSKYGGTEVKLGSEDGMTCASPMCSPRSSAPASQPVRPPRKQGRRLNGSQG